MRRLADPRTLTLTVTALTAAALWVATWTAMGRGDLAALCLPLGYELPGGVAALDLATLASTALMWVLMMAAMMLPSAAPMLAVYAGLAAKEERGARLAARAVLFALGYLALWSATAIFAALAQLLLRGVAPDAEWVTPVAAGALLVVAGLWQFSALKQACLRKCRHPVGFLMAHWQDGIEGALPLGARHGWHCLGCCAGVMGLMFAFGATNLWWMAAIALFCLAERVLPHAERWGRWAGGGFLATGLALVATQLI